MSFIKDRTAPSSSLSAYERHIVKYVKHIFVGLKTSQHFQQPSFRVTVIKQNVTHFLSQFGQKHSRSYQPGYHHHGGTYIDYVSLFLPTWTGHSL